MYFFLSVFLVWIQGQEHQEEEGQHRGVCGRGQGDAEEETEGKQTQTLKGITHNHFPVDSKVNTTVCNTEPRNKRISALNEI